MAANISKRSLIISLKELFYESNSLRARLARGVFWTLAGAIISRGLNLISFVVVARVIGQIDFGKLGMIQNTIGMFSVFAGLGLGLTATKYVAQFRIENPDKAGRILALSFLVATLSGLIMTFALIFLSTKIATDILHESQLAYALQIAAGQLLLGAIIGTQTGSLAGLEAFQAIAKINIFVGLLSILCIIAGVEYGGLYGVLWAMLAVALIQLGINYAVLRKECRRAKISVSFSDCLAEQNITWKFSLPAMIANTMVAPVTWLTSTFLVSQPDGYAEMGIYNAANQWGLLLLFIPTAITPMLVSVLSERFGGDQKQSGLQVLKVVTLTISVTTLLVSVILAIFSSKIMGYYGPQFLEGWPVLCIVALYSSLLAVQMPIGSAIAASGRMWTGFFMNMGWATVMIISARLLVSEGALGLALAFLISYLVHGIWMFWFSRYTLFSSNTLGYRQEVAIER